VFCLCLSTSGGAAEKSPREIPSKPSAPPVMRHKTPPDLFACKRLIVYQDKVLNCDSHLGWDGEGIRSILLETPAAIAELNAYQKKRKNAQRSAYMGSIGIGAFILGTFLKSRVGGTQGVSIRNVTAIAGIGLTAGSFIYGMASLRSAETHLRNAIDFHNQAHPERLIEIQFNSNFSLW